MNRRQFIQMTMTLAAVAGVPEVFAAHVLNAPLAHARWTPTPEEVANWLEYYKAWTAGLRPDIHDFASVEPDWAEITGAELPVPMVARFAAFEEAFRSQESDRAGVAREFLAGYDAGRDGSERYCARFDRPSNRAYAWYHYWGVGHFDRRYAAGDPAARREAASWRSPAPTRGRLDV